MSGGGLGDLPARISAKIAVHPTTGCWLWTARVRGYGFVWWEGTNRLAHRVVWALLRGPTPLGLDHFLAEDLGCPKHCVNPDHLRPATSRENTLRSDTPAARNLALTHCLRGHAFSEENTYYKPNGSRRCRRCHRDRQRTYAATRRSAA